MSLLVTQPAPDFTATAVMPDNSFKEDFRLADFRGKYVLLFFYPLDFTFVCPSEILAFNRAVNEFQENHCQLIGVSTDSAYSHLAWKKTKINDGGIGNIQYPLVADLDKSISKSYEVLLSAGGSVASMIVNKFGEANPDELKALMAAGFVLFLVTLLINFLANFIINRTARE